MARYPDTRNSRARGTYPGQRIDPLHHARQDVQGQQGGSARGHDGGLVPSGLPLALQDGSRATVDPGGGHDADSWVMAVRLKRARQPSHLDHLLPRNMNNADSGVPCSRIRVGDSPQHTLAASRASSALPEKVPAKSSVCSLADSKSFAPCCLDSSTLLDTSSVLKARAVVREAGIGRGSV